MVFDDREGEKHCKLLLGVSIKDNTLTFSFRECNDVKLISPKICNKYFERIMDAIYNDTKVIEIVEDPETDYNFVVYDPNEFWNKKKLL